MLINKKITISSIDPTYQKHEFIYNEPDYCPHCARTLDPKLRYGEYLPDSLRCTILFWCSGCGKHFMALYYYYANHMATSTATKLFFMRVFPVLRETSNFPTEINDLSPTFKEIYDQALQAEAEGLDHLSGVGYRKALEFLVKDYLIQQSPDEKDNIIESFLGECVKKFPEHLKQTATAAVWLGNDFTHYQRKYEQHTIEHLKGFISATVSHIHSHIMSKKASHFIIQSKDQK